MSDGTPVDRLYSEASAVLLALRDQIEPSLHVAAADSLRKALLLAAASHFEYRVCAVVLEFVRERTDGSVLVEEFVRNKAVARQYHSWFKWDENNATHFYGLFGRKFRDAMGDRTRESDALRESVRAFLEVGNERNRLVHSDFASFPLEKTTEEIYELFQKALLFVDILPKALRECDSTT
jgi:hypothetical protein